MKKVRIYCCSALLLLLPMLAVAAPGPSVTAGSSQQQATQATGASGAATSVDKLQSEVKALSGAFSSGVDTNSNAADDIEATFQSIFNGIKHYQTTSQTQTQDLGKKLLGGLALIAVTMLGFKLALEGGVLGSIMSDLIQTMIRIGIASWFLIEFMTIFDGYLLESFKRLAEMVMPNFNSAHPAAGFAALAVNEIRLVTTTLTALWSNGWFDVLTKMLPTLVMVAILGVMLVISALIAMVAGLAAYILMAIGLVIGPIMIPWLVLNRTAFIFDGWLRFIISAGMTLVVIAMITGVGNAGMAELMHHFAVSHTQIGLASAMTANGFMPVMLAGTTLAVLVAYLMTQASDIASKLISGGSEGIGQLGRSMVGSNSRMMSGPSIGKSSGSKGAGKSGGGTGGAGGTKAAGGNAP